MTTLLKDVIVIPEHTGAEDYVLRLTDSVGPDAVAATIASYVVTPALANAFDTALGLVGEAIDSGTSRGAFLTGSFGSGKSHFMAVLHALLTHQPAARAQPDLQPVIAAHDPQLQRKQILPLAFHLLGARSLEQALFDGYLRQIRQLHPGAPLPAVHKSDGLLIDADEQRRRLGDAAFFAELNGSEPSRAEHPSRAEPPSRAEHAASEPGDVWGPVLGAGTWNAQSYAAARAADPASDQRARLVSALVETFFTSFTQQGEFVDIDTGLDAIARHAASLGYDGVVLFLDELVLWLAFSVADKEFFARESQKLTKLVESGTGRRAIPLISFVARQMDLRRWFADAGASGAEQAALDRAFKHQEGRFTTITLGDDNLPFVANKRLLQPRDAAAGAVLTDAFARIDRTPRVWDVLLDGVNTDATHPGADEAAFRLTYPFSPALVSTLRALASVMQRERTALKVMQQMLVDRRERLTVDQVIPVGDAFDHIVSGTKVLDTEAATLFRSASSLYADKLAPMLRELHGLSPAQLHNDPESVPAAYRVDDRLAKTLLLSAIAPNVPALKALTGARLASLNHGSIVSPLPGREAEIVLSKVRDWARGIPEIHVDGSGANPTIRVQLSGVDHESIVQRAKGEDNEGRRRELVKALVARSFGIDVHQHDLQGAYRHDIIWRGSRRPVDILFGNVRDSGWLSDDHFRAAPGTWRVVVDHPFDEQGHSGAEDHARLDALVARSFESRTIVWLPYFLAREKVDDLGRLVILDWLLDGSGERWQAHADHLSETDRALARQILQSHRDTLRRSIEDAIQQAYGAASPRPGTLLEDPGHEKVLVSLDREFTPRAPVGATLGDAFTHLIEQAHDVTYPGHPRFEPGNVEVRLPALRILAAHVHRAVADRDGRVDYQGDAAAVRRLAGPLGIGTAAETAYILSDDRFTPWSTEIARALGRHSAQTGADPDAPLTVAQLRDWIDAITPAKGLLPAVSDLVVITWAALRQRAWFHHGAALASAPEPGSLQPSMELRSQPMPSSSDWACAIALAGHLLAVTGSPHLTAPAVADFSGKVKDAAGRLGPAQPGVVAAIEAAYDRMGLPTGPDAAGVPDRLATARAVANLVAQLRQIDGVTLVERLANSGLSAEATAAGRSLSTAQEVTAALSGFEWDRLDPLTVAARGEGDRADAAADILTRLRTALRANELVIGVGAALKETERAIFDWLYAASSVAPYAASSVAPYAASSSVPGREPVPGRGSVLGRESVPAESTNPHDPMNVPLNVPPGTGLLRGGVQRRPGDSDEQVIAQLRAFLEGHPDDDVEVTWQVRG